MATNFDPKRKQVKKKIQKIKSNFFRVKTGGLAPMRACGSASIDRPKTADQPTIACRPA
jgi:hypothetical protein